MKKIKIIALTAIAFVMIASTIFVSCKKPIEVTNPSANDKNVKTRSSTSTFNSDYYAVGLVGMTYVDGLNHLAQIHNDYQTSLLTQFHNEGIADINSIEFVNKLKEKTVVYFQSKAISIQNGHLVPGIGVDCETPIITQSNYSQEGYEILIKLKEIMTNDKIEDDAELFTKLNNLKSQALNLSNESEIISVGLPVTIAIYSLNYWKTNASDWKTRFSYLKDNSINMKMKVGWGQLGWADAGGAINGAMYGGCGGGPAGAVAGAIVGSSGASLINLFGQVATSKISWW